MIRFKIHNKACFVAISKNFVVYDYRKIKFYDSSFLQDNNTVFSLPKGSYYVSGNIKKVVCKEQPLPKLPIIERDLHHDFRKFKIVFGKNPHKASIIHSKRIVFFDNSFKHSPLYQLIFILMHEKGHNFYKTEEYADLYAVRAMLKAGFTKKQIALSPLLTLSEKQINRKINVIDTILKNI